MRPQLIAESSNGASPLGGMIGGDQTKDEPEVIYKTVVGTHTQLMGTWEDCSDIVVVGQS